MNVTPMEVDVAAKEKPAQELPDLEPRLGFEPMEVDFEQRESNLDPRTERNDQRATPIEELETIPVDLDRPELSVTIGTRIPSDLRDQLIDFLKQNLDVFAWSHEDMVGIDPEVACHKLNIDPTKRPVSQKRRKFGPEKYAALAEEVKKLLDNKLIEQADQPQWVANAVLVKKANNSWRLCIDFTDLNEACPKDYFPMPHIDHLVDSTAGHEMMTFMDAFAGYHQIAMSKDDQQHTSFLTEKNVYCWKRMPFGLKNAGATYQRLVNRMFADEIGKTMEVYIDDIVVKSEKKEDHLSHLAQTFDILRKYNMRLNPKKCSFGVGSGKFLGHIISQRGIEANPTKIKAIMDMKPPRNVKEVQRLTGCLAALNRFVSRMGDKCKPFFEAMKKGKFSWTPQCHAAFLKLKVYLSDPQILAKPIPGEKLFLYLAASESALSAVLVRAEGQYHLPIYFVSQTLSDAELRYPPLEKLAYALIMSVRKLRQYFFDHQVEVLTTMPLRQVLHRPDTAGRLLKWSIELGQFGITFAPRTAIKAQVLADFLTELTFPEKTPDATDIPWTLHVDGSSTSTRAGAGVVLISPEQQSFTTAVSFDFHATNNEAEYEALINGLEMAMAIGVRKVKVYSDSQLVVCQMSGEYETRGEQMMKYQQIAKSLVEKFEEVQIELIPRTENTQADALARLATSEGAADMDNIAVTKLNTPSAGRAIIDIKEVAWTNQANPSNPRGEICQITVPEESWMTEIKDYIKKGTLPEDKVAARRLQLRAARYTMINEQLYKRSFSLPLLKCITPEEGHVILKEIHEGDCGNHTAGQSLVYKTIRQGYYWLTLRKDAIAYAKKCQQCQFFAPTIKRAPEELTSIYSPWPFAKWGIDLIGPFPKAPGSSKFAVVAVDYFTKWAEAEPLATITQEKIIRFIWKNIICRFGLPQAIITDNGKQFDGFEIDAFFAKWKIAKLFSTPYHPQSNGQVEAVNKIIKHTLKTQLIESKGLWAFKLPSILWSYRTTSRNSTGETPFAMAFGTEAVIPAEVVIRSHRTSQAITEDNDQAISLSLDLLEERRLEANLKNASYKQRSEKYYNSKAKVRRFKVGDLVLKRILGVQKGVFGPTWEGPMKISKCLPNGAYQLEDLEGIPAMYPWNATYLKKFYQ